MLDGARPDVFNHLVAAGDMPHVARHVLEPGGGAVPATTVFPSVTGIAYLPFLTGCFPGTCDVPGIRWVDVGQYAGHWIRDRRHVRNYCGVQSPLLNRDIRPEIRSLFDLEPNALAICTPFVRGLRTGAARLNVLRGLLGGQAHYTGWYEVMDRAVASAFDRSVRRRPRFTLVVFPAIDGICHWTDPWHPRVLEAYREFDRAFGRIIRRADLSDEHLIVVVSDHGAAPVGHHCDLSLALEAFGVRTLRHPVLWRRAPGAAVMVSGNSAAHVYVAPGEPRTSRWPLAAIELGDVPGVPQGLVSHLAGLDGVALVAGVAGDHVVVVSRHGRARLSSTDGLILYETETADVLHVGHSRRELSAEEWLHGTIGGPYPDGPVQLLQIFRSARAGDLVVAAAPGHDLRLEWEFPEHRSGHGSLTADHMRCLVAFNRPYAGPMRTVDVFAVVANYLGHRLPDGIDGVLRSDGRAAAGAAECV